MNDIKQLWEEHQKSPFPNEMNDKKINDTDVVEINAIASGCISSFIESGGSLDPNRKIILNNCMSMLKELNPTLVGNAQVYFGKLYRLCDLVHSRS